MDENRKQIERIQEMEEYLNTYSATLSQVRQALKQLEKEQETYLKLRDYYTSPTWFEDQEYSDQADFPADLSCGVLSEDALYDLLGEHDQLALELLDQASLMLKNR